MERIKSVDIVKGMAILVVVISHLIPDRTLSSWITKLFGGLMGLFFVMSGYFYKPGQSYMDNVKKIPADRGADACIQRNRSGSLFCI